MQVRRGKIVVDGLTVETLMPEAITPELRARYLGDKPAAVYLLRPDQHVAARWEKFDEADVKSSVLRA